MAVPVCLLVVGKPPHGIIGIAADQVPLGAFDLPVQGIAFDLADRLALAIRFEVDLVKMS